MLELIKPSRLCSVFVVLESLGLHGGEVLGPLSKKPISIDRPAKVITQEQYWVITTGKFKTV